VPPSPLRILLVDDEVSARDDLREMLAVHPHVVIAGEAGRMADAHAALARDDYDLVLLDVQLRGGTGFDLVPHVRAGASVIFVTAHDRYALRAFEVNALDYLLKPVDAARLAEALRRATATPGAETTAPALNVDDIVHVKTGPGTARFVRVSDIVTIGSQDNYSEIRLANKEHLLVRQTLSAWEDRLPAARFLRVHRQTVVNVAHVLGYEHTGDHHTLLRMTELAEPVRARRENWPALRERLTALGRMS
jgi:two-component system LytT family response regulator